MANRLRFTFFSAVLLLLIHQATAQQVAYILYVTPNGAGVKNGTSWGNAFDGTQLQVAINSAAAFVAANPSYGAMVWVAAGTYKPTTGLLRNYALNLTNKVAVYGGFVGTETSLAQRPNPTSPRPTAILSGDIGLPGNASDNTYTILYNQNLDSTAVLDGFVITGGRSLDAGSNQSGAGMANINSSPTVRNCFFEDNASALGGSAMLNLQNSSPTITNCRFSNNLATTSAQGEAGHGAAMLNAAGSNPRITGCSFVNNQAPYGAAIATSEANPTLENCTFSNNVATAGGGALYLDRSQTSLMSCTLTSNQAPLGGGIYGDVSGILSMTHCSLNNNKASDKGGAVWSRVIVKATNSVFESNTATTGGGLYVQGNFTISVNLTNCLLLNNKATSQGGAVYQSTTSSLTVMNCTLSKNAPNALFVEESNSSYTGITNSILWGNVPTQLTFSTEIPSLRNTLIDQDGFAGTNGNIRVDPLFQVNPPSGTLPLQLCSPAIDAGNNNLYNILSGGPSTDLSGNPRFMGNGTIDLGAFEQQNTPMPVAITRQPPTGGTFCEGRNLTLLVSTTGTVAAYQWFKDNAPLTSPASATTAALNLTNLTTAQQGNYLVRITAACTSQSVVSTSYNLVVNSSQPATRFVTQTGAGNQSGTSWSNALSATSLQPALASACPSTTILVASGLYKPTTGTDRAISFSLPPGVQLYGGFSGNEANLTQRQLSYPSSTTLSGDIGVANNATDNSFHVFYNISSNSSSRLDGVVITNGNANNATSPHSTGGGIYNGSVSPTVSNCLFVSNQATLGGAIFNEGLSGGSASPLLINCALVYNSSTQAGGALCNFGLPGTATPTLINCSLIGNTSGNNTGNAIFSVSTQGANSPQLANCVLFGNGSPGSAIANSNVILTARYCLFETDINGYSGTNNLTTATSPFISTSSVALYACSPAINTGDPTSSTTSIGPYSVSALPAVDLAGNARIIGGRVDVGAIEFQSAPGSPVAIVQQPTSITSCAGSNVTIPLSVSGTGPFSYQFYRHGTPVGSVQSSPLLSNLQPGNAGSYQIAVSGSCTSMTTVAFNVTVNNNTFTLKSGNWTDTSVWSCGRIPVSTDVVTLHHAVSLPASYQGSALRVIYSHGGRLLLGATSQLRLGGN
ncbi:hypothetical protein IC229_24825 [Spirosoma sp. BT702]|uniref:Immunoglobulin domain-containing protein n=1 Tax=Spirosoma profusum TaxID=2771354 RepID=A0A926Y3Z6_9BACT|nr:right-handed parallel beta-helix repeat-containing protein [Spirosoma profusum]MBD2703893.1 hypothetical protein [Spirosoma profusum]